MLYLVLISAMKEKTKVQQEVMTMRKSPTFDVLSHNYEMESHSFSKDA